MGTDSDIVAYSAKAIMWTHLSKNGLPYSQRVCGSDGSDRVFSLRF